MTSPWHKASAGPLAAVLVAAALLTAPLYAQGTPPRATATPARDTPLTSAPAVGDGRIRGRVVRADTAMPLRRVQVTLTGDQSVNRMVTTDGEGRYEFTDLPAGRFTIAAAKDGFLKLQYGQRRPFEPGTPVTLTASQALERVDLALPRAGVINGRVTDRLGDPAIGADIIIERYQYSSNGQRKLTRTQAAQTNDLGEFRVFGLMPGEYLVSANLRQRPSLAEATGGQVVQGVAGYVQTYYPGTPNAIEAQPVVLGLGEEATVPFSLFVGHLARISGTMTDSSGRPAAGADLMLVTMGSGGGASGRGSGEVGADGRFSIANVPPGEHFLQARLPPRQDGSSVAENANYPITINGENVDDLMIVTGPPALTTGIVQWDGTAPHGSGATAAPLRAIAESMDGRPALMALAASTDPGADGTVASDGTFRVGGLFGRVRLSATGVPPQWMVKSITLGDIDLTTTGTDVSRFTSETRVTLVLTDRVTQLTGSVKNAQGQPVTEYLVVVLPAEAIEPAIAPRYTHALRPDQKGAFRVTGLPPGRYVAAAVEALEPGSEWDPAFQSTVRNAARPFTIAEGETKTLSLELMP